MLKLSHSLPRAARPLTAAILAIVVAGGWLMLPTGNGQLAPPRTLNAEALAPLLARLKKQQDDMVANQTKIEAQTAALKVELRLAKIYSARGGGSARR